MAAEIDLRCDDARWTDALPDLSALCERVIASAAEAVEAPSPFNVSILFADDSVMHDLNLRWRGKDKPTDVLSFPAGEGPQTDECVFLGDIAMGWETCASDAADMERDLDFHIGHLLTHGFLHLLGFDHMTPEDASEMESMEAEILAGLGWPHPYETQERQATDNA